MDGSQYCYMTCSKTRRLVMSLSGPAYERGIVSWREAALRLGACSLGRRAPRGVRNTQEVQVCVPDHRSDAGCINLVGIAPAVDRLADWADWARAKGGRPRCWHHLPVKRAHCHDGLARVLKNACHRPPLAQRLSGACWAAGLNTSWPNRPPAPHHECLGLHARGEPRRLTSAPCV